MRRTRRICTDEETGKAKDTEANTNQVKNAMFCDVTNSVHIANPQISMEFTASTFIDLEIQQEISTIVVLLAEYQWLVSRTT